MFNYNGIEKGTLVFNRVDLILRSTESATNHSQFSLPIPNILCQTFRMRNLIATLCLTIAILLGNAEESFNRIVL